MQHYTLEDNMFMKILKILTLVKGVHTKNIQRLRIFLNAVYYILKTGTTWRGLLNNFGDWRAIHKRFKYWVDHGVFDMLFEHAKQDPDLEWLMIDSTIVKAHVSSIGYEKKSQIKEALGRSKGGFTTKIHASVDALGNPLKFLLTPGQCSDFVQAKNLCSEISGSYVIADKGYDSNDFIEYLHTKKCTPVIPFRKSRKVPRPYDENLYKERNIIERFFGAIKQNRRIATRYDKSSRVFMAFLQFAGVLMWLK